jgi:predicted GH43/DUF377 family glycosyl hydrolase
MKTLLFKLFLLLTVFVLSSVDTFAQVNWEKHQGNPVFPSGPAGSWYRHVFQPCVIYNADSLRYEMWFGSGYYWDRPYQIGFATSIDGIFWNVRTEGPVLTPSPGSWDSFTVEWPWVIRENGEYKMWYSGGPLLPGSTGYATSPDGIEWTKHPDPVFEAGTADWEAYAVVACNISRDNGNFKMWYTGVSTDVLFCVGYATSTDGISWQRDTINNPVLEPGDPGQWDNSVYAPRILFIDDIYYMWYSGNNGVVRQIGLATSTDGISNWAKYAANPVLSPTPGQWDSRHIEGGSVLLVNDTLFYWYNGSGYPGGTFLWQIGLATSPFIPVPVEFISFTASSNGKEVILNWSTATEVNNYGFEVQRSTDHTDFFTVGFVNGFGTTTEQQNYSFTDKNLSNGKNYYRLKQVDYDGSFEYSNVIEVEWRVFDTYLLEQNYPNPFNPSTTIGYGIREKSNVKITVINSIGEEVATILNEEKESGYHTVEFNASEYPSGVYFYKITAGEYTAVKKMLLIK